MNQLSFLGNRALRDAIANNLVSFPAQIPSFNQEGGDLQARMAQLYFIHGWRLRRISARYEMHRAVVARMLSEWRIKAVRAGYIQEIPPESPALLLSHEPDPTRILIVDDVPSIRKSLRIKLSVLGDCWIDEADTIPEAVGLLRRGRFDFLILDSDAPGEKNSDHCRAIRHEFPDLKILLWSVQRATNDSRKRIGTFHFRDIVDQVVAALIARHREKSLLARPAWAPLPEKANAQAALRPTPRVAAHTLTSTAGLAPPPA